jgi:hypothetical protein
MMLFCLEYANNGEFSSKPEVDCDSSADCNSLLEPRDR